VSDLYERLKGRIDESDSLSPFHGATRAVLELHKPEQHHVIGQDGRRAPSYLWCPTCRCVADKDLTVRAIARALDVPIGGDQQ
jgi:hypothetical protein